LYHGWQFGHEGECLHIPQLSAYGTIPVNANVRSHKVVERQGLIWIWPGAAELADEQAIPTIPKLNKPGFVHSDKLTELPCDISYVIEHMLDPAHIHITHHGNQGDRAKAQPLEMEILESGYLTSKDRENESESQLNTMSVKPLFLHTELCHSCNQAYQISQRVQQFGVGVAILLAALAILTNDAGLQRGVVLLAVAALIVTVGANKLKHRFEAYSDSHGIRELRG
jgi:phenylpropionate dioxygenase-like ring-hydroxylating dioxygenase large terminal subunit